MHMLVTYMYIYIYIYIYTRIGPVSVQAEISHTRTIASLMHSQKSPYVYKTIDGSNYEIEKS
jgi:hypothetical protein